MYETSYHHNLTSDTERLAGFYEAIIKKAKGTVYDIGAGSGILSKWAAPYADFVYSIEINSKVAENTRSQLKSFKNIEVICADAKNLNFPKKADLIICEMLDTALIDEEQIPVLNSILKKLKPHGEIIPHGIINCVEPVSTDIEHLFYDDIYDTPLHGTHNTDHDNSIELKPKYQVLGKLLSYHKIDFKGEILQNGKIHANVDFLLDLKINRRGTVSGVKLTTFTLLTPNIICGPTPMMNPPLVVPTESIKVDEGDTIQLKLSYIMGGGLDSVEASIKRIS
ncbi:methyltransferase domain-containing protein [Methanobacterium aggregans]|uniref:methyltransferase domain-containing protein n=1 Tax=Methanobacterium aggregans TaxID=1615586 RepID=UPI001AE1E9EF|nr:methyltransferase domain-containing protein [Methanobacterium aggregans]MBP2045557.1 putative RNA methylase [Methanobacterium aggregans]